MLLKITGAFPGTPKLVALEGVFVRDDSQRLWRLMEHFDRSKRDPLEPYYSSKNFYPASVYPSETGEAVLRRTDLEYFEQRLLHHDKANSDDTVINAKLESSYLNLVGALCELYWREIRVDGDKDIVQARIIERLMEQFPGVPGLSERTLKYKLSSAIKAIRSH